MKKLMLLIATVGLLAVTSCGDGEEIKHPKYALEQLQASFPSHSVYEISRYQYILHTEHEILHAITNQNGELQILIVVTRR